MIYRILQALSFDTNFMKPVWDSAISSR